LKCLGNKLFVEEFFGYGDDNVLGLILWNHGCKLISVPEAVAEHARGLTFGSQSYFSTYLSTRNRAALACITNTRYGILVLLHIVRNALTSTRFGTKPTRYLLRALVDGVRLGNKLKNKGIFIDIYRAPLIKIPPKRIIIYFTTKDALMRYREDWVMENLLSKPLNTNLSSWYGQSDPL